MIDFLKYRWLYFCISSIIIGLGLFSFAKWGFRYSIDFVGGTNLEFQVDESVPLDEIKKIFLQNDVPIVELSQKGSVFSLRTNSIDEKKEQQIKEYGEKNLSATFTILRLETVGPVLGKETIQKTLIASILAILGILLYMGIAFKGFSFAVSAILAMFHDFFVVIGAYSLLSHFFGAEVDLLFVTALLTTMSFSVHDTIIIFDTIREYKKSGEFEDVEHAANKALMETFVRSLNNSVTIIFMLLALVLLGGSTIKFFIITLLIGTITGTYSSPCIATPLLVWFEKRKKQQWKL